MAVGERICWNCGYYESNSPAYKLRPELFRNVVRDDPIHFMKKFLNIIPSDESKQSHKPDEDVTEPITASLKR